jgi:hypothetical protein
MPLTAKLVEEWVLQELAFIGHDMLRVQTLFISYLKYTRDLTLPQLPVTLTLISEISRENRGDLI